MLRTTSNLGGFEIGLVVATILFGICTVQTTLYFVRFPKDPLITRVLVMILWPLLGVQIALMGDTLYRDICVPSTAIPNLWKDKIWQTSGIVVSGLVQTFYARRIYGLCRCWLLSVTLGVLILLKFAVGFAYIFKVNELTLSVGEDKTLGIFFMVDDAVVDQLIALSMTLSLVKRRTRFANTNLIISRLVGYAVGTGLVTSVLSLVAVVSFIACNYNWLSTMLNSMVTCVHFSAMLANLHTRSTLKKFLGHVEDIRIPFTTIELHPSPAPARDRNETASGAVREVESDHQDPSLTSNGDIS